MFRFSDGTTFTKTGGEYGSDDITWFVTILKKSTEDEKVEGLVWVLHNFLIIDGRSADFTAWKSGQPKADATSRGNQDCVRFIIIWS